MLGDVSVQIVVPVQVNAVAANGGDRVSAGYEFPSRLMKCQPKKQVAYHIRCLSNNHVLLFDIL